MVLQKRSGDAEIQSEDPPSAAPLLPTPPDRQPSSSPPQAAAAAAASPEEDGGCAAPAASMGAALPPRLPLVNILSSVALVFVNKAIFSRGLCPPSALVFLHFAATAAACRLGARSAARGRPGREPQLKRLPGAELVAFVAVASAAFTASNLSLAHNPVAVHQIFKILMIPCSCLLEAVFQARRPLGRKLQWRHWGTLRLPSPPFA